MRLAPSALGCTVSGKSALFSSSGVCRSIKLMLVIWAACLIAGMTSSRMTSSVMPQLPGKAGAGRQAQTLGWLGMAIIALRSKAARSRRACRAECEAVNIVAEFAILEL